MGLGLCQERLPYTQQLPLNSRIVRWQAPKSDKGLGSFLISASQQQPPRRFTHEETGHGPQEHEDTRGKPYNLILQTTGCNVQLDTVYTERGHHQGNRHANRVPCCQQPAYLSRSNFNNGDGTSDTQGSNPQARDDSSGIQSRCPRAKHGHQLPNYPDEGVQPEGPQTSDTVIDEEGQGSPGCIANVHERDKVSGRARSRFGADAEMLLET